jgi:predicted lipid-binding transport protein (Tim44 family)
MPEIEKVGNTKDSTEVVPTVKNEDLPAINLPQTKTPVSFNQQVNNFQQIPPSAWDGLTSEQRLELTRSILAQMDSMDKRHFDFAVTHVQTEARRSTIGSICGALIAILGFSLSAFLSLHGQTIVALSISMPLATILAIVVGNRFVTRP